jgi:hypothetical protein
MIAMCKRFALFLALGLAAGCGSKQNPDQLKVYPTRGKLVYQGQPAAGALVRLHPRSLDKPLAFQPRARVRPDGTFELTTYDNHDGAPAGDFAVTIEGRHQVDGDETAEGANFLPEHYNRPETTPFQVQVQALTDGANELPTIELAPGQASR